MGEVARLRAWNGKGGYPRKREESASVSQLERHRRTYRGQTTKKDRNCGVSEAIPLYKTGLYRGESAVRTWGSGGDATVRRRIAPSEAPKGGAGRGKARFRKVTEEISRVPFDSLRNYGGLEIQEDRDTQMASGRK